MKLSHKSSNPNFLHSSLAKDIRKFRESQKGDIITFFPTKSSTYSLYEVEIGT